MSNFDESAAYIHRVAGRRPSELETAATLEWCREWVADTFGPEAIDDAMTDVQVLRGCDRHIDGGLSFVLEDVRRCA